VRNTSTNATMSQLTTRNRKARTSASASPSTMPSAMTPPASSSVTAKPDRRAGAYFSTTGTLKKVSASPRTSADRSGAPRGMRRGVVPLESGRAPAGEHRLERRIVGRRLLEPLLVVLREPAVELHALDR